MANDVLFAPSFSERNLKVVITLPNDVFINNSNVISIDNAKIKASILLAGAASLPIANISIYGLPKDTMDKLTVYQWNVNKYTNAQVTLYANNNVVFNGTFQDAFADYSNMPDVPFNIHATFMINNSLKNVSAISFNGPKKVIDIAQAIVKLMDNPPILIDCISLKDSNGAFISTPILNDVCLTGSPLTMLWRLQKMANINATLWASNDADKGDIILTYIGESRSDIIDIPLVTSETGLVGSPIRKNQVLWSLRVLYHPSYVPHGIIRIQSKLVPNGGDFYATIQNMTYSLESQTPNGQWFIDMDVWLKKDYVQ